MPRLRLKRVFMLIFLFWHLSLIYMLLNASDGLETEETENEYGIANLESLEQMIVVQQKNSTKNLSYHLEIIRNIRHIVTHQWYAVSKNTLSSKFHDVFLAQHNALIAQLDNWRNLLISDQQRRQQLQNLQKLVQSRLHNLQHPINCSNAPRLICRLNKPCGFGCQIHHVTYCLITAYGTGRTMILDDRGWQYSSGGWTKFFKPVTECDLVTGWERMELWTGFNQEDALVVAFPSVEVVSSPPDFLPLVIPQDLAENLLQVHDDPSVWWVGQFVSYLLRPSTSLKKILKEGTIGPTYVGVHVRRSDKLVKEAERHSVFEYMDQVENYFKTNNDSKQRRVFLASDDPGVFNEIVASRLNDGYQVFHNRSAAIHAFYKASRYSEKSLYGLLRDVFMLASSDFLVCTFSSHVGRLAYELMQTQHNGQDMSHRFRSLDDVYYFGGPNALQIYRAWMSHNTGGEMELRIGDEIRLAGHHWNGFSKGRNLRTGKTGLFPSYKAFRVWKTKSFPQ